jgi:hypothetical protein
MTATLLRKGFTEHYGPDNEELTRFALQPFRGRKRSKKPEEEPQGGKAVFPASFSSR